MAPLSACGGASVSAHATLDAMLAAVHGLIETDIERQAPLRYHLTNTKETHEAPMFLCAVCIILRMHVLGHAVCILLGQSVVRDDSLWRNRGGWAYPELNSACAVSCASFWPNAPP